MTRRLMLSYITSLAAYLFADGQSLQPNTSAQLFQSLNRLNVLGRVLYIGAHPDDENNQLIAYLANGALVDVAYLSITRGERGAKPGWRRTGGSPGYFAGAGIAGSAPAGRSFVVFYPCQGLWLFENGRGNTE